MPKTNPSQLTKKRETTPFLVETNPNRLTKEDVFRRIVSMPPGPKKEALKQYAIQKYGQQTSKHNFLPYRFDPAGYIKKFLGWEPWSGDSVNPGQVQIMEAYTLALRQQMERRDFEKGIVTESELQYWQPGQVIKNYIRVEAGHTTGKTKTESGLVNHFLDCFPKAVVMMYGPSQDSLKDNLWQELLVDRRDKDLPGRILDSMEIRIGDNHYAKCKVTSDSHGKGSEKLQGKHPEFGLFILDEAEGIADYVFEAIDSMASGGICVVLMVANPKTRTSKFHKMQSVSNVKSLRMSCLFHPNVIAGYEKVPNAVRRHYVEMMVEKHCDVVLAHNEEDLTFTLPYPITIGEKVLEPGTIYRPNFEFMFRVLGVAPPNMSEKTVIPFGVYDAATKRKPNGSNPEKAWLGVDCAMWGIDKGTLYIRHAGKVWKAADFPQQDGYVYWETIRKECFKLKGLGVETISIRFDVGGGFGSAPVLLLSRDQELKNSFKQFQVVEVQFGSSPEDKKKYDNLVTQMYFETAESLKGLAVENPPEVLEIELTEREYKWVNKSGESLRRLESKEEFKKRKKTGSPDDGDGFVLCVAPDHCFKVIELVKPVSLAKKSIWD